MKAKQWEEAVAIAVLLGALAILLGYFLGHTTFEKATVFFLWFIFLKLASIERK